MNNLNFYFQVGIDKDISFAKPPNQPSRMRPSQKLNYPRREMNRPGKYISELNYLDYDFKNLLST